MQRWRCAAPILEKSQPEMPIRGKMLADSCSTDARIAR
jgi:hypothetical protein